jgi:hypothetical protein
MVDCVVVAKPEHHWQTFAVQYDPAFSSEIRARVDSIPPIKMGERKIIARRAALELNVNSVAKLANSPPTGGERYQRGEDHRSNDAHGGAWGHWRRAGGWTQLRCGGQRPNGYRPTLSI